MKVAVIQMPVLPDKQMNIEKAAASIHSAARSDADLVVLPEMFCCPYETAGFPRYAEAEGGPAWSRLSRAAAESQVYLVAGSMPECDREQRVYNTAYVFDRQGRQIGKHRKIHLFDIAVEGGQCFKESDTLSPGNQITVFDTDFCRIGLAICYDIRFPELSRLMVDAGARIIIVPAAFNMTTGPAHWDLLFRTRAVDNQVFMIGAAPARQTDASYVSYGHSLVASPWGDILTQLEEGEGMAVADLDLNQVAKVRAQLPLLSQRRADIYRLVHLQQNAGEISIRQLEL
ncbi:MAG: carbon-nitrogen hydrolase family protein [Bacillota bacterium]|nr:carbon-nitrogen hydrolase family protein [Bacillota bacterium]